MLLLLLLVYWFHLILPLPKTENKKVKTPWIPYMNTGFVYYSVNDIITRKHCGCINHVPTQNSPNMKSWEGGGDQSSIISAWCSATWHHHHKWQCLWCQPITRLFTNTEATHTNNHTDTNIHIHTDKLVLFKMAWEIGSVRKAEQWKLTLPSWYFLSLILCCIIFFAR